VSNNRVMRGLKGSRTLPRGRLRRGSKRERAAHAATVLGSRPRRPGGLHDRQALAIMAVVDLAERLVIDHDRLRHQARALPPAPPM